MLYFNCGFFIGTSVKNRWGINPLTFSFMATITPWSTNFLTVPDTLAPEIKKKQYIIFQINFTRISPTRLEIPIGNHATLLHHRLLTGTIKNLAAEVIRKYAASWNCCSSLKFLFQFLHCWLIIRELKLWNFLWLNKSEGQGKKLKLIIKGRADLFVGDES